MKVAGSKKGNVSLWEAMLFVAYVVAAIATFGLGSINLQWVTDFGIWIVVVSALGVFALDKQTKKNRSITAIEIGALFVAIGLPLAAAGYIPNVDISSYLTNATNQFILFVVSVAALIVAAKQD